MASALAASVLIAPEQGRAAILTESFSATVASGPFAGLSGSGSFSYDSDAVASEGFTLLTPFEGLTLTFTVPAWDQTFTEADDADYDFFPEVDFFDGVPFFLDFLVSEEGPDNPVDINADGVFNFAIVGDLIPVEPTTAQPSGLGPLAAPGSYTISMFVNVPEPSGAVFAAVSGLGLCGLGWARWRARKRAR
jgi:hypothetical protein